MNIFESLPHVDQCCFCIGLKTGSIIIAVIHLCFIVGISLPVEAILGSGAINEFSKCYSSGLVMKILGYMAIVVAIALLAASIYFIIGIIQGIPDSVVWFMYASLLLLVFNILVSIFMFLQGTKKGCSPPYFLGGATLVGSLILFYFLVVLASFHRVMMYR